MMNQIIEFKCKNCGKVFSRWEGHCNGCNSWNSLIENIRDKYPKSKVKMPESPSGSLCRLSQVEDKKDVRISSGVKEFDELLGGGIVEGSLTLIGGEPGVGKSTLLMQILGHLETSFDVLYISGEEITQQVKQRAERLKVNGENILFLSETMWEKVKPKIIKTRPKVLVIDSIQTLHSNEINSAAGNAAQIREMTFQLMETCKQNNISCFIIGHITKDGAIAGPKLLEHMVDTVVYLHNLASKESDNLKVINVKKNRFGLSDEIKIMELTKNGFKSEKIETNLISLKNEPEFGRCFSFVYKRETKKLIEIESLVTENKVGSLKRVCLGYPISKLNIMLAVAEKYLGMNFSNDDVYLNVLNGDLYKTENFDLAVICSILSSKLKRALPNKTVFAGTVSLTNNISAKNIENSIQWLIETGVQEVVTDKNLTDSIMLNNAELKNNIGLQGLSGAKDILQII